MSMNGHQRLMIPGPVDVRDEVMQAMLQPMIGHRSTAFAELYAGIQSKLRQVFMTENRVFLVAGSATGLWEGASRCAVRDDYRVLHLVGGAFSDRWAKISTSNGKQIDVIEVEWGKAHTPEMVKEALDAANRPYDAVALVHNETSTGVLNPIKEIAAVVREYNERKDAETLVLVDTVSGILGADMRPDEWGIDVALVSSQKAFALPPGLAFASVSDRVLERAKQVENRGYYFDFVELEKRLLKNNTPNTPPISIMYAADKQLDLILEEGVENRIARHERLRDVTHQWVESRGFGFFAEEGYRSPTLTALDNREKGIDVNAMAEFMGKRGFAMDKGYGPIKGKTFRIAHMGDIQMSTLEEVLDGLDEFMGVNS